MTGLADLIAFLVAFGVAVVALASGAVSGQPGLPLDDGGVVSTGNVSVAHSEYDGQQLTLVIENSAGEPKNVTLRTLEGVPNDSVQVPAGSHVVYEASVDAGDRDRLAVLVSPEGVRVRSSRCRSPRLRRRTRPDCSRQWPSWRSGSASLRSSPRGGRGCRVRRRLTRGLGYTSRAA